MKIFFSILLVFFILCVGLKAQFKSTVKQQNTTQLNVTSSYYKNIDIRNTKTLFNQLSSLIVLTHTKKLRYSPDTWQALKKTDSDLNNPDNIILIYGSNNSDKEITNDYSRDKNSGGVGRGKWNREHVYPKSLGNPNLGIEGPGADIHMLRPSDVKQNSKRGNLPFENASGEARKIKRSWYPGDKWRGDVARIIMYMYLRYNARTIPSKVAVSTYKYNKNMPDLFLNWNYIDSVDDFEKKRNEEVFKIQRNRNPFIDNPYLAYLIWGGPVLKNKW